MFTRKRVMTVALAIAFASVAHASDVRVTSFDSGTQIWIEAEDYDSKTTEYTVDVDSVGPSGRSLYFPDYSDRATIDPWWGEYSIDSADPDLSAVSLTGTWYCWVRVNQPEANAEEADYLLVKGDDGTGISWYDTAIATVDDVNDIIGNAAEAAGASGVGSWQWLGYDSTTGGVAKNFALDTDGKIVFRMNEREGGEGNIRIDSICWASEPNYIPDDIDFGQAPISDGLVFEMNAAHPGSNAMSYWVPAIPDQPDDTQGKLIAQTTILGESVSDGYNWFYRFTPDAVFRDQVISLTKYVDLSFINDDWCTIEAWVRVPAQVPNSKTKSMILGNVDGSETGWRFGFRCSPSTGKYACEFLQRDSETSETSSTGFFHFITPYFLDYSTTEWVHMVFVKYAAEYIDADNEISMNHDWYVNGVKKTHGVSTTYINSMDEFYFQTDDPQIGTTREDLKLAGDVALIRVYNRLLHADEILTNYNAGLTAVKAFQCGAEVDFDVTGDCKVDMLDFAEIAQSWLEDNTVYPAL